MLSKKLWVLLFLFLILPAGVVKADDTTPPVSVITSDPSTPNGENGWFTSYPNIFITATDNESGVSAINYKINDDDWVSTEYFEGLNLVQNPSFESGYINNWDFVGPFLGVGYKSSLFKNTGNYSAGIINLSPFFDSYFKNDPIAVDPNTQYTLSFYFMSITSWVDNGFYEVVAVMSDGSETILASGYNIDLKLNFKQYSTTFVTPPQPGVSVYVKLGVERMGHLNIDDVSISRAGESPEVSFLLNREGQNTILFYSEDALGNIENTKQATINIDTISPNFTNFEVYDQEGIQIFASRVDVSDATSGLVDDPVYFNYAVDGFTNGYYENYESCSGNFLEDEYIVPTINYSLGANSGNLSTPKIDYCDSNWVNCKRLNFFVKDIAGNVGNHSICVNGPYITSTYGNVFGRDNIYQMGLGTNENIWGVASTAGSISDVAITSGLSIESFNDFSYLLNIWYDYYSDKLEEKATTATSIDTQNGLYLVDSDTTITDALNYTDANQVVFVGGNLNINANITNSNSFVTYIVNGDVTIDNLVTQLQVGIISTNQIYTSGSFDLATRIDQNGFLIGRNLVFSRNTDRTLGASEVINFPVSYFFVDSVLNKNNIYWKEVVP